MCGSRVTLLAGGYTPTTGGEAYNFQVCQHLREQGCRVRYLHVYTLRFFTLVWLIPGVGPLLASVLLAPALAWLPGLLLEDEHTTAHLIGTNLLRKLTGRGKVVIIVHHMADYRSDRAGPWSRFLQWARLGPADLIVANSVHTRDEVLSLGIPPERVVVVPPGFEPAGLQRSSPPLGPLEVLCVGSCTPRKGFATLLQALAQLPPGSVRVRVAGTTREPHYRQVLRPLAQALGSAVSFEGRVSAERLRALYASSHLLVLPSLQEGFSITVSEAMYCGLPVLASDLPALRDRVEEGRTGLLFPPGDAPALARALRRLAEDRELLRVLSEGASLKVDSSMDWSACRAAFWEAIGPLITGGPERTSAEGQP